ncbi:energy-coupling factor transporter ATPase [Paenibacillus tuaregi]|uniref:energy-coupling factor transporter ATPase n=1 Tax=Paenibacillus tuaregi TaxID=1816681 RepID=UPI000839223C|nr:energy-coupling factor transporter ATPase [Paenibacillus tuaregi]
MLTFNQVHYYYKKGHPLIDNMSFTIQPGEFVAIIGPNGCGKSTLARLMNGLILPKEGHVRFKHLDTSKPADLAEIYKRIGLIFQNPEDQFITTTVMDEVLFGMENIRVPREEMAARLQHVLRAVHMEEYMHALPHELSGGQKQRVAIASILAMRPECIIFDEATSMLDPQGREEIMSMMHELHRQGMTVIHITHHMEEVLHVQRVLLIQDGRIEFDGDPLHFFENVSLEDYQLEAPFAVRLHKKLGLKSSLMANWKEMIRSQWSSS